MDGLNKSMYDIGSDSAFAILARSQELEKKGKHVINLGIGQPDFPTAPNIVESAVKALRDGNHGYSSSNGILELREAVADDFFNRNNVKIDPLTPTRTPTTSQASRRTATTSWSSIATPPSLRTARWKTRKRSW